MQKGIESVSIVTIIDSERWEELSTVDPVLIETQSAEGNTVLINKIDLITEDELEHIKKELKSILKLKFTKFQQILVLTIIFGKR